MKAVIRKNRTADTTSDLWGQRMKVKLADVCERGSSNLKQADIAGKSGDYPVYGASGYIGNVDFYQRKKPYVAVVKDGAGIGRAMLLPAESSVIGTMQYLLPKSVVLPEYLFYVVKHMHLEKYFSGATIPHIYFRDYQNEEFTLDDLNKQHEVVTTLRKVESVIENRQQQLEKMDELIKARFVELFGDLKTNPKSWKVVPFSEFAEIDGNMTTDYEKYADYPHIGIDSIEKGTGELKGYRTVREDGIISGKYLFTPQHIIYSKIRPNLNKVALPSFNGLCSADAYPILPNSQNCNRVFLATAMRSEYFLEYILQFSSRTNLPKVNRKEISGFHMPLPPLELQNQFAAFVEQVNKSKAAIQKSLDEAQLLFDSLMQQYFG